MTELVTQAKQATDLAKEWLLKALQYVPDDKLTWTPSPTAKSALRIAAHAGVSNHALAGIVRGEGMPGGPVDDTLAGLEAAEAAITTREQVIDAITESTVAVHEALQALTPELIASTVETPFMTAPMTFFMNLPALHMNAHAAQIEYLQTIWGDVEFRM